MENRGGGIKLKHLIEYLEEIQPFENPKEELEQYQTNAQIAGEMLHYISNNTENFYEKRILDLGCGTGILGIAAAISGCL
jgi:predicted RNA methylase